MALSVLNALIAWRLMYRVTRKTMNLWFFLSVVADWSVINMPYIIYGVRLYTLTEVYNFNTTKSNS